MIAWIVAVGSELLTPFRTDTNSLTITDRLNGLGYEVRFKAILGDRIEDLIALFSSAVNAVDLLVCTGGLGPTADDLTRDAIALALDVPLDLDDRIATAIQQRFERRGLTMPEINRRQAMVPRGAIAIDNTNGTAPGLWIARGRTGFALLPGPPREMLPMLDRILAEYVGPRGHAAGLFRRVIKITGRSESDVDSHAAPVYTPWLSRPVPITTTILASLGQIELHLTTEAPDANAAAPALDAAVRELCVALGDSVYSTRGEALEAVIGALLRERGLTVAAAESCTGGLLSSRLTDVPGSSAYFDRAVVCYSNEAKTELLGVPASLITEHGAVSEPVARAMAEGVRARANTSVGIGITGIAGPDGGTPQKPVGTVAIAVATADGLAARTFLFLGGREMVKFQASQAAMNMLRLQLTRIDSARRPS